jgi:hypothetical protein
MRLRRAARKNKKHEAAERSEGCRIQKAALLVCRWNADEPMPIYYPRKKTIGSETKIRQD